MKSQPLMYARRSWLISAAFLLALCWVLYASWDALSGPFLFDDYPNLQHMALLGGEDMSWRSIANFMAQYGLSPGRPLSLLSFVINDFTWPSEPWSFKYTNLLLHALIGVVVFATTRTFARLLTTPHRADFAALLTMAAWLIHPMQLSTSMLVVQRMTQLSALFVLLAVWTYTLFAQRATRPIFAVLSIASLGLFTVFATLCKETGTLAPLLALILNGSLLRAKLLTLPKASQRILLVGTTIPIVALALAIAANWEALTNYSYRDFSMSDRLLTQSRVLLDYLRQILVPSLRGSGIYHDDFVISRGILQPWTTLPAVVLVVSLLLVGGKVRKSHPAITFSLLWLFGAHILESSVFPVEMYFEHRNYLPMLGPLFGLAYLVSSAPVRWRKLALFVSAAWIAFAGWLLSVQAPIWGDAGKLSAIWMIEHPMSARGVQQRAKFLLDTRAGEKAASLLIESYEKGVRGEDFPIQALNVACVIQNSEIGERALPLVVESLASGRHNTSLLESIGKLRLYTQRGACPSIIDAEGWFSLTTLLLQNPHYFQGSSQNFIHVERAYYFQDKRDLDATMREFEAAWDANPDSRLARLMAATLASAGLYEDARTWATRAIEANPEGMIEWLSDEGRKSRRLEEALDQVIERRGTE